MPWWFRSVFFFSGRCKHCEFGNVRSKIKTPSFAMVHATDCNSEQHRNKIHRLAVKSSKEFQTEEAGCKLWLHGISSCFFYVSSERFWTLWSCQFWIVETQNALPKRSFHIARSRFFLSPHLFACPLHQLSEVVISTLVISLASTQISNKLILVAFSGAPSCRLWRLEQILQWKRVEPQGWACRSMDGEWWRFQRVFLTVGNMNTWLGKSPRNHRNHKDNVIM